MRITILVRLSLLLVILSASPCWSAPPAFVQITATAIGGAAQSSLNTPSATWTAGNSILASLTSFDTTGIGTVTATSTVGTFVCDSGSGAVINTYVVWTCLALNITGGTDAIQIASTVAIAFGTAWAKEYSGVATASARDANAVANQASGTSTITGAFTTAQASEVISCVAAVTNNSDTYSAGLIGGVAANLRLTSAASGTQGDEDLVVSSIQTGITGAMTNTSSAASAINCLSLKGAGGGASPPPSLPLLGVGSPGQ